MATLGISARRGRNHASSAGITDLADRQGWELDAFYGDLPAEQQDRMMIASSPSNHPEHHIAEMLTIEGV